MEIQRPLYLDKIKNRMHNGMIKVITGIRRSGKSYLLFRLFRQHLIQSGVPSDHILAIELDRLENEQYREPFRLLEYLHGNMKQPGSYYILLDEVQMLGRFEEVLNSLLHEADVDVYVTGSNSKFLSKDIITEFRGRGDEIHVFPLSFKEFMTTRSDSTTEGWADYIIYGGLPLAAMMPTEEQKAQYLDQLFRETYIMDIIARNKVRQTQELEDIIDVLASSVGTPTNPTKLQATFQSKLKSKISLNTLRHYIEYLCDAFLIHEAKRYDVKGRKYIGTPLKYYFEDVGLRNARLNFRQVEETHLMENVLYNELRLRGFNVDIGTVPKRTMDSAAGKRVSTSLEIDFVANQGRKRYYIQSSFRLPDEEKVRQEKASLLALHDSFKKIIVVKDTIKPRTDNDGILTLGLYDFLLNDNCLEW